MAPYPFSLIYKVWSIFSGSIALPNEPCLRNNCCSCLNIVIFILSLLESLSRITALAYRCNCLLLRGYQCLLLLFEIFLKVSVCSNTWFCILYCSKFVNWCSISLFKTGWLFSLLAFAIESKPGTVLADVFARILSWFLVGQFLSSYFLRCYWRCVSGCQPRELSIPL